MEYDIINAIMTTGGKTMGNRIFYKQRTKEYYEAKVNENPEIAKGKLIVSITLISWFIIRLLEVLAQAFMAQLYDGMEFNTLNAVLLIVILMFSMGIYKGARALAYLPIAGSVVSLGQAIMSGLLKVIFSSDYYLGYRMYCILFVFMLAAQTAAMLIILFNNSSKAYLGVMDKINKQVMDEAKKLNI
jgi:hypothetical protein